MASLKFTNGHCVLVRGVSPAVPEKVLKAHFGSKKNGGHGDVDLVLFPSCEGKDTAVVFFNDIATPVSVLNCPHVVQGQRLIVEAPRTLALTMAMTLDNNVIQEVSMKYLQEKLLLDMKRDADNNIRVTGTKWQILAAEDYLAPQSSATPAGASNRADDETDDTEEDGGNDTRRDSSAGSAFPAPPVDSDSQGGGADGGGNDGSSGTGMSEVAGSGSEGLGQADAATTLPPADADSQGSDAKDGVGGNGGSPGTGVSDVAASGQDDSAEHLDSHDPFKSAHSDLGGDVNDGVNGTGRSPRTGVSDFAGSDQADVARTVVSQDGSGNADVNGLGEDVEDPGATGGSEGELSSDGPSSNREERRGSGGNHRGAVSDGGRANSGDAVDDDLPEGATGGGSASGNGDIVGSRDERIEVNVSSLEGVAQVNHAGYLNFDPLLLAYMKEFTGVSADLNRYLDQGRVAEKDGRQRGTTDLVFDASVTDRFRRKFGVELRRVMDQTVGKKVHLEDHSENTFREAISKVMESDNAEDRVFVFIFKGNALHIRATDAVVGGVLRTLNAVLRRESKRNGAEKADEPEHRETAAAIPRNELSTELTADTIALDRTECKLLCSKDSKLKSKFSSKVFEMTEQKRTSGFLKLVLKDKSEDHVTYFQHLQSVLEEIRKETDMFVVQIDQLSSEHKTRVLDYCMKNSSCDVAYVVVPKNVEVAVRVEIRVKKDMMEHVRREIDDLDIEPASTGLTGFTKRMFSQAKLKASAVISGLDSLTTSGPMPPPSVSAVSTREPIGQYIEDRKSDDNTVSVEFGSGPKIYVYNADITRLFVESIVCASNENMVNARGVAKALSSAAGPDLDQACAASLRARGPLKWAEVRSTDAGNLPCGAVLHARGPSQGEGTAADQAKLLKLVVWNIMENVRMGRHRTVAIPALGAGTTAMPLHDVAVNMLSPIIEHGQQHDATSSVTEVHVVDIRDEVVTELQRTLQQLQRDFSQSSPGVSDEDEAEGAVGGGAVSFDEVGEFADELDEAQVTVRTSSDGGARYLQGAAAMRSPVIVQPQAIPPGTVMKAVSSINANITSQPQASANESSYCGSCAQLTQEDQSTCGHTTCRNCKQVATCRICQSMGPGLSSIPQGDVTSTGRPHEVADSGADTQARPDLQVSAGPAAGSRNTSRQPPGNQIEERTSEFYLPGFEGTKTLVLKFDFPGGHQTEGQPDPGRFYTPKSFHQYLPDTKQGRILKVWLKQAYLAGVLFVIDSNGDIVPDIPLKTEVGDKHGPPQERYPDPGYFQRVEDILRRKGVAL